MRKIATICSLVAVIAMSLGYKSTASAATVSDVTASISNPVINQYYSARISFYYDAPYGYGPNVIVSNLPPGIMLANPSSGSTDAIYALSQKNSNGYYYIDLIGTSSGFGTYNIQVYLFDTTHTFDVYQNYSVTVQQSQQNQVSVFPLYRLYNSAIDDHLYTTEGTRGAEGQTAGFAGYREEGVMGYIYSQQVTNTAPLYRMYSPRLNNHFYTTDVVEMENATLVGFRSEGIVGYLPIYATPGFAEAQIYRLYNHRSGDHFYTTDYLERDRAVSAGYIWEGGLNVRLLNNP